MNFSYNGSTSDYNYVAGNSDLFMYDNYFFYAVAYRITLAENDDIRIYSSKPDGDSYLYLYRAVGDGGYEWAASNDDGGDDLDSYIYFTAFVAGDYYIVVTDISPDRAGDFSLTVWNTESSNSITLPELLSNYSITIPYSYQLEFNDHGNSEYYVAGNSRLGFRNDGNYYYAVSYCITLAENDHIRINSSKSDGDSFLIFYRADKHGGYDYVTHDDDGGEGNDSYINFTIDVAGIYYIVITDYSSERAGVYSLDVTINAMGNEISYTELDYSQQITVGGNAVTGKLSDIVVDPWMMSAAGHSFKAQAGINYRITVDYRSDMDDELKVACHVLTCENLTGNEDDDFITGGWNHDYEVTELTVEIFFVCKETGLYRILLSEYFSNELDYSISIEEFISSYLITFNVVGSYGSIAATVEGTPVVSPATVAEGKNIVFTATPNNGYRVKEWKLNGKAVSGNTTNTCTLSNIAATAAVTVEFGSNQITNVTELSSTNPFHAWMHGSLLHVTGLTTGETLSLYTASGVLVYHSIATSETADIPLEIRGIYVVKSGNHTVKVVF